MNEKLNAALVLIGRRARRQDSLKVQLYDASAFIREHQLGSLSFDEQQVLATRLGMFEAADYIKKLSKRREPGNDEDTELDRLRKDLLHQLGTPDELDWNYFVATAKRAQTAANNEKRNMTDS
jgi:hypothetical protein